ncbi:MAG: hypothetical protein H0U61_14965 [Nocardioidaceae bacterium]|nr:hypothetical protein [Nocardioidaceae bacterium]
MVIFSIVIVAIDTVTIVVITTVSVVGVLHLPGRDVRAVGAAWPATVAGLASAGELVGFAASAGPYAVVVVAPLAASGGSVLAVIDAARPRGVAVVAAARRFGGAIMGSPEAADKAPYQTRAH